jgi:hypothetical protein
MVVKVLNRKRNLFFELNDKEMTNLEEWRNSHKCRQETPYYAEEFVFVGTGIGTCATVRCTRCKDKKDITDISCW